MLRFEQTNPIQLGQIGRSKHRDTNYPSIQSQAAINGIPYQFNCQGNLGLKCPMQFLKCRVLEQHLIHFLVEFLTFFARFRNLTLGIVSFDKGFPLRCFFGYNRASTGRLHS